jgi:exonuclease VII small subunit
MLLRHCQATLSEAEQRVKVLEGETLVDLSVGDNGPDHDEAGA